MSTWNVCFLEELCHYSSNTYLYTSEGKRSTGPHIRKLNLFNGFLNWVCFAVDTPSKYLCRFPPKISIKQNSNALITLMKSFPKHFLKDVTCPWIGSQLFKIPKCCSDLLLWFFPKSYENWLWLFWVSGYSHNFLFYGLLLFCNLFEMHFLLAYFRSHIVA